MTDILRQALATICDDLERIAPDTPSLHFARGVLAASTAEPAVSHVVRDCKTGRLPIAEIVAAWDAGEPASHICERYGVSSESIYRVVRANGRSGKGRPRGPGVMNGGVTAEAQARREAKAEHDARIAATYRSGKSLLECAVEYDTNPGTVRAALRRQNVPTRNKNNGRKEQFAPERRARAERIMALRAEGKTLEQIGDALGVTRERVRQIVTQEGLAEQFAVRPLTAEQKATLRTYETEGVSLAFLSQKLGVSEPKARVWLIREGVPVRPERKKKQRLPQTLANAERAAQMYQQGTSTRDIAVALGLSGTPQIYRLLGIAGVKTDRVGRTDKRGAGK